MQLSAPTLPIDPGAARSADATGFPAVGGKGDANPYSSSDFGAMLSAESRGNSRSSSAARSNPRAATKEASDSVRDNQGTREFSSGGRSASSAEPNQSSATTAASPEALAVAAGLIVPTTPTGATQEPPVLEIDLTLNFQPPTVSSDEANTPGDMISSDQSSAAPGRIVSGRAAVADLPAGESPAGTHAHGLRGESPAGTHAHGLRGETPARSPANIVSEQTTPADGSTAANTSVVSSIASVINGNQAVAGLATDAGRLEQIAGRNAEAPAAVMAHTRAVVDESNELEAFHPLAANVREDGSAEGPEIVAPGATAVAAEKIAAQLSRFADRLAGTTKSAQRVSLTSDNKQVDASYAPIGINVAKPEALMPAHASTPTPAPVAIEHASFAAMPLSFDNLVKEGGEGTAGQLAQVARRAVESALAVADQYVTGDQRSVKLQFTVGGEQLAVRVELKGNQVHTTFRTDSPELRNALAQEWQSVSAAQTGLRPQRLADPVFASNSSTGQGMSSDSGAAHQRDSGARHSPSAPEEIFDARHTFTTTTATPAVAVAAPTAAAREPSSIRLHTFA